MTEHQNRFYELLKKVRLNAVCLVDAFGWSDSNLGKHRRNFKAKINSFLDLSKQFRGL